MGDFLGAIFNFGIYFSIILDLMAIFLIITINLIFMLIKIRNKSSTENANFIIPTLGILWIVISIIWRIPYLLKNPIYLGLGVRLTASKYPLWSIDQETKIFLLLSSFILFGFVAFTIKSYIAWLYAIMNSVSALMILYSLGDSDEIGLIIKIIIVPILGIIFTSKKLFELKGKLAKNINLSGYQPVVLKYMKRIRISVVVVLLLLFSIPISPFFITKFYHNPQNKIEIERNYTNDETKSVLEHIELLDLNEITGCGSENLMSNTTLMRHLNDIHHLSTVDIFYPFIFDPSFYGDFYWNASVYEYQLTLVNLTTIGKYFWNGIQRSSIGMIPPELYIAYWINGTLFGKFFQDVDWLGESMVIYEGHGWEPLLENVTLQAKWVYIGEFHVSHGSLWGSGSHNVFQYLFLDEKLDPVYFLFGDYYLHGP